MSKHLPTYRVILRRLSRLLALLVLATSSSSPLMAQLPGHAYVPLEHWSMPYVEYLIASQIIPDPRPMVRPFTVEELRMSLASVDSARASARELRFISRLETEFRYDDQWTGLTVEADAGVRAATHSRLNSNLRESGDGHVFPRLGVNAILQAGAAAVIMHPEYDPNFKYDPDYGGKDVSIKMYYREAYVAIRAKYIAADLGRLRRNWGPVGLPSLLASSVPYPYDQFSLMVGPDRVYGHFLVADLDPMLNGDGVPAHRYFAAQRIAARPWDFVDVAFWGAEIITGPDQPWALWFINPVAVYAQSRDEQNQDTNVLVGGDSQLRLGRFRLSGAMSLDDLQIISSPAKNNEPASLAMSGVVEWSPPGPGVYSAAYSLISNLSYRAQDPAEPFLIDQNLERDRYGAGLAPNFSDYDLLTLRAGFFLGRCLLIKPELSYLRQGEGDLRQPFPPKDSYEDLPIVHTGVVEKTLRAAVQGEIAHPSGFQLSFDVGVHQISDYQHVEGASKTKFVGVAHLRYVIGTGIDLD